MILVKIYSFYRCCEEREILRKQKSTTTQTGTTFTIRCEPNPLNQTSYAQPGGLSVEYLRTGGNSATLKNGENILYRDTNFDCHHNKKWESIKIAQPNSHFNHKTRNQFGNLSDDGENLMVKFDPKVIALDIQKNVEMPLRNFAYYCVSEMCCFL